MGGKWTFQLLANELPQCIYSHNKDVQIKYIECMTLFQCVLLSVLPLHRWSRLGERCRRQWAAGWKGCAVSASHCTGGRKKIAHNPACWLLNCYKYCMLPLLLTITTHGPRCSAEAVPGKKNWQVWRYPSNRAQG